MSDQEENTEEEREGIRDIIKRIVSVGVGAAFMTDESVKKLLHDLPLPKDIVNGLLQNARQGKTDFLETVRQEIKNQVGRVDAAKLVDDLVERYDIEVNAKVSFKRKENPPVPSDEVSSMKGNKNESKAKASRKTHKD
jgi:polyhydroxyalkanoate synthesis regulator phasin